MPRPHNPDLSALRLTNPVALGKRLEQALVSNNGNVSAACAELGISRASFFRWRREQGDKR